MSFSEHRVRIKDIIEPKHHIFGQHTIHILPYSTASFAPTKSTSTLSSCFCLDLDNTNAELTIPILFNNTEPQYLSYSITPFGIDAEPSIFNITIAKGSLISVGGSSEAREITRKREDVLDLELEDADDQRREADGDDSRALVLKGSREVEARSATPKAQSSSASQRKPSAAVGLLFQLPVKHAGRVKLERVLDKNHYDARLSRSEILVVECPKMSFASKSKKMQLPSLRNKKDGKEELQHLCPGDEAILDVQVRGVAPLELSYSRIRDVESKHHQGSNGNRKTETFMISHISANATRSNPLSSEEDRAQRLATVLNSKSQSQNGPSFDWAMARDVHLPVTVEHSSPGRYNYELEQVKDACGNVFGTDTASSKKFRQEVQVHPRRQAYFVGCDGRSPISLLQGGPKKQIKIQLDRFDQSEGPFEVQVGYQGAEEDWQRNLTMTSGVTALDIDKAGTYTLEGVNGQYCAGTVMSPWMCTAEEIPPPTSVIEVDPIQDQCAGPVGVKAMAVLSGTPPFKIKYTIQSKGRPASTHEKTIDRTRDEIEFRPSAEGEVTYTFTGLSDANYQNIKLDGPTFTQILHPIAKAAFEGAHHTRGPAIVLHSCEGNTSVANVQLEGVGPFELSYAVRTGGGELAYTKQVKNITSTSYPLHVEVPKQVAEKGGLLTVTLTSIKDAKGCERPLTTSDLSIDVRRTKPSVTFMEPRETLMLEGAEAKLSIRLSGEGPWRVRYRREGEGGPGIEATFNKAEAALVVAKPGNYILEEVSDHHCLGSVIAAKNAHVVSIRPRPKAAFELDSSSQLDAAGILSRRAVCVGQPDSINVRLEGHFPIEISYQHRLPNKEVGKDKFTSAQDVTTIQLFTGVPGQHTYELHSVGDAIYKERDLDSKATLKKLSQEVYPLPQLTFDSSQVVASKGGVKANSLCLGDRLGQQKGASSANVVQLTGKTPFTLDIEIKDGTGATRKSITRSGITTHQYKLDIETQEFVFDKTGKWSVEVVRISDGNGCQRLIGKTLMESIGEESGSNNGGGSGTGGVHRELVHRAKMEIEVVETANISALESKTDHCVGETIEFGLQGTPPWTVSYEFQGVVSNALVRTPIFSRIAEKPGKLQVKTVAHQQNKCQNMVDDQIGMTKIIHPLPSVYVKEGKHYIEDLREGNQAEIVFSLKGEPPFSFSIQRTQAIDRFQKPSILESHTITDIHKSSYSLFTAEEGTWSVTWLRDRFCEVSLES
jgi:nucleoporin POM152